MDRQFNENDWKLFRKKLPDWQEAVMERLNREYIELLSGPGSAAEKFWKLDKRLKEDEQMVSVVADMRRSMMDDNILSLLMEGAIGLSDLDGFSEELRAKMTFLMRGR